MEWKRPALFLCLLLYALHCKEENRCRVLYGDFVEISCSRISNAYTLTVFFRHSTGGNEEKVVECDLRKNKTKFDCDTGKGYTLCGVSNTSVNIKLTNTIPNGSFTLNINNGEKERPCIADKPANNTNKKRRKRDVEWKCHLKEASEDWTTRDSSSSPPKLQENSISCENGTGKVPVKDAKRVKRNADCNLQLSEGSPENFQQENGVDGLAIGLGLGITATAVAVVVTVFTRNRLEKLWNHVIVGTDKYISSDKEPDELSPLNPGIRCKAEHKEIEKPADQENEKMIDFHDSADDQPQCVLDIDVYSDNNPLNVQHN